MKMTTSKVTIKKTNHDDYEYYDDDEEPYDYVKSHVNNRYHDTYNNTYLRGVYSRSAGQNDQHWFDWND